MNLTRSQNPDSMLLGSAKIELSRDGIEIDNEKKTFSFKNLVDLGLARGIKISFSSSKIDVKADNGEVPLKGQTDMKAKVEFSLLERHLPYLNDIMAGLVSITIVPMGPIEKQETIPSAKLKAGVFYGFTHQSCATYENGTKPQNIIISQNSIPLKEGKDYKVLTSDDGLWGVKFIQGVSFTTEKDVRMSYKIHLVKEYTLTKGSGGVVKPIALRLTNRRKSQSGKIIDRVFEFPYGFYDGEDSVTFKSKNDSDNIAEVPISFEFSPHPDLVLDASMERMSLYVERAGA